MIRGKHGRSIVFFVFLLLFIKENRINVTTYFSRSDTVIESINKSSRIKIKKKKTVLQCYSYLMTNFEIKLVQATFTFLPNFRPCTKKFKEHSYRRYGQRRVFLCIHHILLTIWIFKIRFFYFDFLPLAMVIFLFEMLQYFFVTTSCLFLYFPRNFTLYRKFYCIILPYCFVFDQRFCLDFGCFWSTIPVCLLMIIYKKFEESFIGRYLFLP